MWWPAPIGSSNPPAGKSIQSFGAKGDGVTNDSAAFNLALASGDAVYVPAGTYLVHDIGKGVIAPFTQLNGDTAGKTILKHDGTAGTNVLNFDTATFHTNIFRNLYIDGNNTATYGVYSTTAFESFGVRWLDSWVENTTSDGWHCGGFTWEFTNCQVDHVAGHGFFLDIGPACTITNCYAHTIGASKYGYVLNTGDYFMAGNNGIDGGGGIISIGTGGNVNLTAIHQNFEFFTIDALLIGGASSVTLIDGVFLNNNTTGAARKAITKADGAALTMIGNTYFANSGGSGAGNSWASGTPLHGLGDNVVQYLVTPLANSYNDNDTITYALPTITNGNYIFAKRGFLINQLAVTNLVTYGFGNPNDEGIRSRIYGYAQPTTGTWTAGDFVENSGNGSSGGALVKGTGVTKYIIHGWKRLTTGSGNVTGTDWIEMRIPVNGNAATA